jgi:hypothetical protein
LQWHIAATAVAAVGSSVVAATTGAELAGAMAATIQRLRHAMKLAAECVT